MNGPSGPPTKEEILAASQIISRLLKYHKTKEREYPGLRSLARSVIRIAKWQHRCPDGVGGCLAVSELQMQDLVLRA